MRDLLNAHPDLTDKDVKDWCHKRSEYFGPALHILKQTVGDVE